MTRRGFLASTAAGMTGLAMGRAGAAGEDLPWLDLHVHLDNSTLEAVLGLSRERNVKFGIVEHAGTKENVYPVVLGNDEELKAWIAALEGWPVYKGVQAEWIDWTGCFSKDVLARLDFVLTDAMTMPGKDGRRRKLWEADAAELGDAESFMDRYVDWHVRVLESGPVNILANVSWLPEAFKGDHDRLWTERRVRRIAEAAVKRGAAIEISGGMKLPKRPFLQIAKAAGAKFSFGTNGRYPNMGKIDYCLETAQALGLTSADIFVPTPKGPRAAA
ncbi:MAG TPA: hypothetical protein PKO36_14190 [Candidatus Hydrogenedentes bacterium]|nr:hypothetical protein [Candidatus Hydrogenedentota bacterium]HOV72764.1 hypothetical protein [Candidatus Hydrogenedentota bacterium]HRT21282.1 hypothetical protein [Candidatus Hydrogenedentota bacterium]HRT65517.1 hypothetical protein [Candidatus Hydrogenedentota bacterium]